MLLRMKINHGKSLLGTDFEMHELSKVETQLRQFIILMKKCKLSTDV